MQPSKSLADESGAIPTKLPAEPTKVAQNARGTKSLIKQKNLLLMEGNYQQNEGSRQTKSSTLLEKLKIRDLQKAKNF